MADSDKAMAWAGEIKNQERVKYFFQGDAIDIGNESSPSSARLKFAQKILYGEMSMFQLTVAVTTNPTVKATIVAGSEPSDSDLDFTCESLIEPFAKAGDAV